MNLPKNWEIAGLITKTYWNCWHFQVDVSHSIYTLIMKMWTWKLFGILCTTLWNKKNIIFLLVFWKAPSMLKIYNNFHYFDCYYVIISNSYIFCSITKCTSLNIIDSEYHRAYFDTNSYKIGYCVLSLYVK